jgi:plasmid stabilization system protein ParE
MVYEVEWSEDAIDTFEKIITYLEQKWSEEIAADFAIKVSDTIEILQQMPLAYPVALKEKGIRRCVIKKHTKLFYRVENDKVFLLAFFDSRQNPDAFLIL